MHIGVYAYDSIVFIRLQNPKAAYPNIDIINFSSVHVRVCGYNAYENGVKLMSLQCHIMSILCTAEKVYFHVRNH